MILLLCILFGTLWFCIGFFAALFWTLRYSDVSLTDLLLCGLCGILMPATILIISGMLFADSRWNKPIIKRRL